MKYLLTLIFSLSIGSVSMGSVTVLQYSSNIASKPNKLKNDQKPCKSSKLGEIPSDKQAAALRTTKIMELPVDHFNESNKETWKMRFTENDMFFETDSPIFIRVCGQSQRNDNVLKEGLMFNLAEVTNGLLISTEHRFYGGEGIQDKDIKYLHSKQALQDLNMLLCRIKKLKGFQNSKVVLVGEGYGASLAVWMKQKYPKAISAVIADTPLLLAKLEFPEYAEQLTKTYMKKVPISCTNRIKAIAETYFCLIKNKKTKELIKYSRACPKSNLLKKENQQLLAYYEASLFEKTAEHSKLDYACERFDLQHRIDLNVTKSKCTQDNNKKYNFWTEDKEMCNEYDFESYVKRLKYWVKTDKYYRLYQSCNEFGSFLTTSHFPEPYRHAIPIEFYIQLCSSVFGTEFGLTCINKKIKETNKCYGGAKPKVSNVVFVHGELDPWKRLGINNNVFDNNEVVQIEDESHKTLLDAETDKDTEALTNARAKVMGTIKRWIGLQKKDDKNKKEDNEHTLYFLEVS